MVGLDSGQVLPCPEFHALKARYEHVQLRHDFFKVPGHALQDERRVPRQVSLMGHTNGKLQVLGHLVESLAAVETSLGPTAFE